MDFKDLDELQKQIDIVEVIGSYIPLSRVGKSYRGLCPFHADKNPSMYVSREKNCYTCFSCSASGNVFKFVQNYKKCSFPEAVREVCQIAGLKVPSNFQNIKSSQPDKYERYYNLMNECENFYSYQLKTTEQDLAKSYIAKRNLTSQDCDYFKIGYCPESGFESINYLKSKGYQDDENDIYNSSTFNKLYEDSDEYYEKASELWCKFPSLFKDDECFVHWMEC